MNEKHRGRRARSTRSIPPRGRSGPAAKAHTRPTSLNPNGRHPVETATAPEETGRRSRSVFDGALNAMVIVNDLDKFLDVNPAACSLFGLAREELLGRRGSDFAEPGFDWEGGLAELLRNGKGFGEFRLVRADGNVRATECSATAHVLLGRHLVILHDVTERKQMETALRESEALYRILFESSVS